MSRFAPPVRTNLPGSAVASRCLEPPFATTSVRLAFLDGLRALAALAVFGYHAALAIAPDWAIFFSTRFDLGHFGVVLFFLCSGFIIPVSLERHRSLRRFWINRVCRLYPLYWCSAIVVLVGFALLAPGSRMEQGWTQFRMTLHTPLSVLANLTMLQSFLGMPDLMGIYWTLAFELMFYGIVSLLFVARLLRYSVLLAVSFALAAVLVEVVLPRLTGRTYAPGVMTYLALMFTGTVLYRHVEGSVRSGTVWAVSGLALLLVLATTLGSPPELAAMSTPLALGLARLGAIVVFVGALHSRGMKLPRLVLYLGQISYSLYLWHTFVIIAIPQTGPIALTVLLWLLCLIGVAALTYRWVEQPGMALGRWLMARTV